MLLAAILEYPESFVEVVSLWFDYRGVGDKCLQCADVVWAGLCSLRSRKLQSELRQREADAVVQAQWHASRAVSLHSHNPAGGQLLFNQDKIPACSLLIYSAVEEAAAQQQFDMMMMGMAPQQVPQCCRQLLCQMGVPGYGQQGADQWIRDVSKLDFTQQQMLQELLDTADAGQLAAVEATLQAAEKHEWTFLTGLAGTGKSRCVRSVQGTGMYLH